MKRLLTLFPLCENVHLIKDVGMVPYILGKHFNYDSTIACYENDEYRYLDTDVSGLSIVFIKKVFGKNTFFNVMFFLLLNFRKYDILQVYHLTSRSIVYLTFFKMLNFLKKSTRTYLKLDAGDEILKIELKGVKGWIIASMLKGIDVVSVETTRLYEVLKLKEFFANNLTYLPNGFYDNGEPIIVADSMKEKFFLTVGRIGTHQKATEVLLKAFIEFCKMDEQWNLKIAGPIEEHFHATINELRFNNPKVFQRIRFIGEITNRADLQLLYKRASIFILPSRFESFGIVFVEAMSTGCQIISSDITPAHDLGLSKWGRIFPVDDHGALSKCMIEMSRTDSHKTKQIQKFAYDNFYWPRILERIDEKIR